MAGKKKEDEVPWEKGLEPKGAKAAASAEPVEKPKAPPIKVPKTLGACADLYAEVRDARLAQENVAPALEEQEKFLKAYLIDNLPKSQAGGIAGKFAQVTIVRKVEPRVENWDDLYKFILKTKDFSVMGRTLSKKAIEELWAAKKVVPGVGTFDVVTLSLHKLK